MSKKIVIVGGGPGGVAAAVRARQLGAETILVEMKHLGGVCMNLGCIPMRILGSASEAAAAALGAERLGLLPLTPELDPEALKKRLDRTVNYLRLGTRSLLKTNGVTVIEGNAALTPSGQVQVEGKTLASDAVILAVGADWAPPEPSGAPLDEVGPPDLALDLTRPHRRMLIAGEADWAVELAAFFSRFGRRVILAAPGDFLPRFDRQIGSRLRAILKKDGIEVLRQTRVGAVKRSANGLDVTLTVKGKTETRAVDRVILADRTPRTGPLDLPRAGIETAGGAVVVNSRLETTRPGVFAIGDLVGPPYYSHKASAHGITAAENAMGAGREFDGRNIPSVVYTRPEAASVGLTEKQARAEYDRVVVGEVPYGFNARAMAELEDGGVARAVFGTRYQKLLGVHLLGPQSAELITQAVMALKLEATADELAALIAPHPSYAESLADAARMALGRAMYAPNPDPAA
ncbi:MAG: NAD(P)/FAD-dependent oxidoreductase [Proteobacteria bacterium]|nr:NAD(P)/FAD-dependent oxidoreductase [Pseudomonadota bacterium]